MENRFSRRFPVKYKFHLRVRIENRKNAEKQSAGFETYEQSIISSNPEKHSFIDRTAVGLPSGGI